MTPKDVPEVFWDQLGSLTRSRGGLCVIAPPLSVVPEGPTPVNHPKGVTGSLRTSSVTLVTAAIAAVNGFRRSLNPWHRPKQNTPPGAITGSHAVPGKVK